MPKHEFGIIPKITTKTYDTYEPKKYQCISVDDEYILPILEQLDHLDTFAHTLKFPFKGLAYYGITLIPPTSLKELKNILDDNKNDDNDLPFEKLIQLIDKAILEEKYIIHFGV